ncbi:MAG: CHRD domain-containing protein [Acidobacteria bacterium]|nr:CHRD domain-containing protein [Acidobacteriota bacterium]
MKRLSILALALVFAIGCDSKTPTSASDPNNIKFTAALLPGNEVPPVTNADAGARGTLTLTLKLTKDAAGTITAATGDFTFDLSGFPAGTTLTGAHIHNASAGVNAGVVVNTALGAGEIVLVNGAQVVTKNGINVTAAVAQGMIDNPSGFYFNVHTTINTGGAIRAQLTKS